MCPPLTSAHPRDTPVGIKSPSASRISTLSSSVHCNPYVLVSYEPSPSPIEGFVAGDTGPHKSSRKGRNKDKFLFAKEKKTHPLCVLGLDVTMDMVLALS